MILVDTSIWVEHLRAGHPALARLLDRGAVLGHPWVAGELALGNLAARQEILGLLHSLPQVQVTSTTEVTMFVESHQLDGLGIGYVDAQLLAATRLTPDARLWTNDKRLGAATSRLDLLTDPATSGSAT